jgi:hypothetical protein
MGCWDIYCLLCGNPCHSVEKYLYSSFLEDLDYYSKKNNKLYKQYLKLSEEKERFNELEYQTKWMNSCVFLTVNNYIIKNCVNTSCCDEFESPDGTTYIQSDNRTELNMNYGVFVHTDCHSYIKSTYNIELVYSYLCLKIEPVIMKRYQSQLFDLNKQLHDGAENLCRSPLEKNHVIDKTFKVLKIRPGRSGPVCSASLYPENTYKIGVDKNIWKKREKVLHLYQINFSAD